MDRHLRGRIQIFFLPLEKSFHSLTNTMGVTFGNRGRASSATFRNRQLISSIRSGRRRSKGPPGRLAQHLRGQLANGNVAHCSGDPVFVERDNWQRISSGSGNRGRFRRVLGAVGERKRGLGRCSWAMDDGILARSCDPDLRYVTERWASFDEQDFHGGVQSPYELMLNGEGGAGLPQAKFSTRNDDVTRETN